MISCRVMKATGSTSCRHARGWSRRGVVSSLSCGGTGIRQTTHICAPVFFLLTGTSAYLTLGRMSKRQLSRFLLTRGLWLIFLEVVVMRFALQFNFERDVPVARPGPLSLQPAARMGIQPGRRVPALARRHRSHVPPLPLVRECEAQPNRLVAQLSLSPPSRLLLVTSSHRDALTPSSRATSACVREGDARRVAKT